MDDILLLEAIENYLGGKMSREEREYFENLRKTTPEVDQMVVEHSMFLQQMDTYAAHRNLKHNLHDTHFKLLETGEITENPSQTTRAKVIQLWRKYKRVTAIAASVGGVIALMISVIAISISPKVNNQQIKELGQEVAKLKEDQARQKNKLREVESKIPTNAELKGGGSCFLIDAKGYLVTNAHVLRGATSAVVVNSDGREFTARIIASDDYQDLALLKIEDKDFKSPSSIPYSFKKTSADLGEEIYTLGYPRNDIVYNEGYLSARTGYKGDTLSYQMSLSANPGNSGGPVLNRNGEIIGVLSTRQTEAVGVVFAVKNKALYRFIDEVKKSDTALENIKLPASSYLRGKERTQQVKQLEDYVYQVKAF
jgi:serine protease Do